VALRDEDIRKIVATFEDYAEIKRYSHIATLAEIEENDWNLNIRRYADTSPPPEIFDVRAILHGGIPVREVESEYIQEAILDGLDVSVVFNVRHSRENGNPEYYEFKPEIESKESIREHLGTDDQKIIARFEHWWDKYRTSLKALDAEVEKAESVMSDYLAELGYDS